MNKHEHNGIAIVGFILAIHPLTALVGLILSVIGRKIALERSGKNYNFAVAGMTISIIWCSLFSILFLLVFALI